MRSILLFGAGKSATVLIDYLLAHAASGNWKLIVVDANPDLARSKTGVSPHATALSFDIQEDAERNARVAAADVVISLLPPALHRLVAASCLQEGKHLLTASYIDNDIRLLADNIRAKNLLFLCEMGLDPGIDHMSAMRLFRLIRDKGGRITSFISHCGGLVAPESDNNPWHYKISWNPRNILLAGKAGAHYRENGKEITLPYSELFNRERPVKVPGLGKLGWYPNRDSLGYATLYGLDNIPTLIRTTLRHPLFISGWNWVVRLQLTDETRQYDTRGLSLRQLFTRHLKESGFGEWLEKIRTEPDAAHHWEQLQYLGFDSDEIPEGLGTCSMADILQWTMERKLALGPDDRDLIVMLHEMEYTWDGGKRKLQSSLLVKGQDSLRTAMARTVGLPLGIAAKLILEGRITVSGLQLPLLPEIYEPVLVELERNGIQFTETETDVV